MLNKIVEIENAITDFYGMKWANTSIGKIVRIPFLVFLIGSLPLVAIYALLRWIIIGMYRFIVEDWTVV